MEGAQYLCFRLPFRADDGTTCLRDWRVECITVCLPNAAKEDEEEYPHSSCHDLVTER